MPPIQSAEIARELAPSTVLFLAVCAVSAGALSATGAPFPVAGFPGETRTILIQANGLRGEFRCRSEPGREVVVAGPPLEHSRLEGYLEVPVTIRAVEVEGLRPITVTCSTPNRLGVVSQEKQQALFASRGRAYLASGVFALATCAAMLGILSGLFWLFLPPGLKSAPSYLFVLMFLCSFRSFGAAWPFKVLAWSAITSAFVGLGYALTGLLLE